VDGGPRRRERSELRLISRGALVVTANDSRPPVDISSHRASTTWRTSAFSAAGRRDW